MKDRRLKTRQRIRKAFLDGGGRHELVRDARDAHPHAAGIPQSDGSQPIPADSLKRECLGGAPDDRARATDSDPAAAAASPSPSRARPATPGLS